MKRLIFDPSTLQGDQKQWFDSWLQRAERARAKVILAVDSGKNPTFDSAVWSDLKSWLLENVSGKNCAYCETPISAGFYGDAEHYRPKGAVTVREEEQVVLVKSGDKEHPGYYWLAYHWKNLLPSCQRCNSGVGKGSQFPAKRWITSHGDPGAEDPETLDKLEEPLLLHPYFDKVDEHLVFGRKGQVVAREGSEKGKKSIEVLGLDRSDLVEKRQQAQEDGWTLFLQNSDAVLDDLIAGRRGYASAIFNYIKERIADLDRKVAEKRV